MANSKAEDSGAQLTSRKNSILGIVLFGIATYAMLSLWSFTPTDPSRYSLSIPATKIYNWSGSIGAKIASEAIFFFGAMSYYFIIALYIFAFQIAQNPHPRHLLKTVLNLLTLGLGLLWTVSYIKVSINIDGYVYSTVGLVGHVISVNATDLFGHQGRWVVILCIFAATNYHLLEPLCSKAMPNISMADCLIPLKKIRSLFKKKGLSPPKTSKSNGCIVPVESNLSRPFEEPKSQAPYSPATTAVSSQSEILEFPHEIRTEIPAIEELSPYHSKSHFVKPSGDMFTSSPTQQQTQQETSEYKKTAGDLAQAFDDFGISGQVTAYQPGPVVTVYEYQPAAGTKLSKLVSLSDDIALNLRVDSVFIHPVTGKKVIGVQVPNKESKTVLFGDIAKSPIYKSMVSPLSFIIGKNLKGEAVCEDLSQMPHLLMAGQTGSGKSVAINTLLCSILMKCTPDEVRLILVDPKILELKVYEGIPHLLLPVITEPDKAATALKWACAEMDRRYKIMEVAQVRHITSFNEFWSKASTNERNQISDQVDMDPDQIQLPFLVIVIDALADLMLTAPKEVEASIQRLAQKARACGIHLVLATQRPSVDVITGVIKANLPSRIAFKVFSRVDSRTILDNMGAERLLGKGDMLYLKPGSSRLERIQGAFITDREVVDFVSNIKEHSSTCYDEKATEWIEKTNRQNKAASKSTEVFDKDEKWDECISIAQRYGHISASFLQRQLKIGYNRAARIIEDMEQEGLVGPQDGSKPRKWLGAGESNVF